jgi:hypothetical protein
MLHAGEHGLIASPGRSAAPSAATLHRSAANPKGDMVGDMVIVIFVLAMCIAAACVVLALLL